MKNYKRTLLSTSIVSILVVAILGISYSYFTANLSGGESASTINLKSGKMEIAFSNTNEINLENIYPKATEWVSKSFTVTGTNTTDLYMFYRLTLIVDKNTFSSNAISVFLNSYNTDNNGDPVPVSSKQVGLSNGTSIIYFGDGYFETGTAKKHTYILKVYFKDTGENQNADQNKEFAAHIGIEAINY